MKPHTIHLDVEPIGLEADFDLAPGHCLRVGSSDKMEIPLPDSGLDSYHLSIERRKDGSVYVEFFGEGQIVRGGNGVDEALELPAKFEAGGLRFRLAGVTQAVSAAVPQTTSLPSETGSSVMKTAPGNFPEKKGKGLVLAAIAGAALLLIGFGGVGWWLSTRSESGDDAPELVAQTSESGMPGTGEQESTLHGTGNASKPIASKAAKVATTQAAAAVQTSKPEEPKKPEKFKPTEKSPATVAVLEFENNSGDEENEPLRKGLRDMMTTDLAQIPVLKVVERARLENIMEELKLSEGKYIDPATAVKLGKGLAARAVLSGSYTVVGETMRLDTRLVDVETGEVLMAEKMTGQKTQFFELQQDLVAKLVAGFEVEDKITTLVAKIEPQTRSYKAFGSYSRGVSQMELKKPEEARRSLKEALQADPNFSLASKRLQEAEREAINFLAAADMERSSAKSELVEAMQQSGFEESAMKALAQNNYSTDYFSGLYALRCFAKVKEHLELKSVPSSSDLEDRLLTEFSEHVSPLEESAYAVSLQESENEYLQFWAPLIFNRPTSQETFVRSGIHLKFHKLPSHPLRFDTSTVRWAITDRIRSEVPKLKKELSFYSIVSPSEHHLGHPPKPSASLTLCPLGGLGNNSGLSFSERVYDVDYNMAFVNRYLPHIKELVSQFNSSEDRSPKKRIEESLLKSFKKALEIGALIDRSAIHYWTTTKKRASKLQRSILFSKDLVGWYEQNELFVNDFYKITHKRSFDTDDYQELLEKHYQNRKRAIDALNNR